VQSATKVSAAQPSSVLLPVPEAVVTFDNHRKCSFTHASSKSSLNQASMTSLPANRKRNGAVAFGELLPIDLKTILIPFSCTALL
jgi:hypothetical protein